MGISKRFGETAFGPQKSDFPTESVSSVFESVGRRTHSRLRTDVRSLLFALSAFSKTELTLSGTPSEKEIVAQL
ncbi:MAG: hypothetical protein A2007_00785 [Verrucomicrobia bacterium GWC2_42_7]|nr:MAG: hypothetical protein A2007_00785 [Verrucomicrobia bacterium GWC2_42_7]